MSTAAEHHAAAETLLAMADQAALRAIEESAKNPMAALPGIAGAVVHLLAAQVHATLAIGPCEVVDGTGEAP